jgi:hypothetical protein
VIFSVWIRASSKGVRTKRILCPLMAVGFLEAKIGHPELSEGYAFVCTRHPVMFL